MKNSKINNISKMFEDGFEIDKAVKKAIRAALEEHKRLKNCLFGWNGTKVVMVQPHEINFNEES